MEKDKEEGKENSPLFNIVAGTSIGAMNAAVLVSNVVRKNKTWSQAVDEVERFWKVGIALKEGTTSDADIHQRRCFRMFHLVTLDQRGSSVDTLQGKDLRMKKI